MGRKIASFRIKTRSSEIYAKRFESESLMIKDV